MLRSCPQRLHSQRRAIHARSTSLDRAPAQGQKAAQSVEKESIIEGHTWEWRHRWHVYYETAGTQGPPLVFLPGFGVGCFHFRDQLRDLGSDHRVWVMDLLGQGNSWPSHDPAPHADGDFKYWGFGPAAEEWAGDLIYSVDTWTSQIEAFLATVVKEPVYLLGNSLGGYLAVSLAARRPDLVKGVCLVNATPFWAFIPSPKSKNWFSRQIGRVIWAGAVPVPRWARWASSRWWDALRNPGTIRALLAQVYCNRERLSDELVAQIVEPTSHPAAASAFASIIFAPKPENSFNEGLHKLRAHGVPLCLMYGREDPWVRPVWGQQAKRIVPNAPYFEISPAGHCPHHEAYEVFNILVRKWIAHHETDGEEPLPERLDAVEIGLANELVCAELVSGEPRNAFERIASGVLGGRPRESG
ncbi:putative alpha/beta hydrolase fold containing-protein [Klebsormidium nitens]|uniref:Putative alpha/beta hydrolase fold containing-protein n=1 Tax=Klebsormidium nitens TaxID=105231 RepID=A0A1Y1I9I5_KLENI|nr:putative alpha/beta hydrolase fold containing-protein [Klebsormidium nitens]|eukprot:GAQ85781.1 putative alpha/beta hydrolase fold containing-protein [Klebsormidium nitens]